MEDKRSGIFFERRLPREARRDEDDWGGLSEAKVRRRIQNRLHQRSYRRKRALEREANKVSATHRPRKPASLAPRRSTPAADQRCISPAMASESPPAATAQLHQSSLHSQTLVPQITSASPARACAALLSDWQVRRLHHYAFTVLWPSFKHYSLETSESLTSAFFRLGMMDDLLLASFIWPAALAMSMHLPHTTTNNDAIMLACQNKVIKGIREHIQGNKVSDSVICAVLTLTVSTTDPRAMQEETDDRCSGFDPPFRSLGWNQIQSCFTFTRSHMQGLHGLVATRGGLQNIMTPGIAEQVQSTDILQASLSSSRPHFTLCRLYQHVLNNQVKLIRPPRERIESTFPISSIEFKDLLLDIRMYCRHLETLVDEAPSQDLDHCLAASVSWETAVYRNLIQHRLLCLPRSERQEEEFCRLAALIFSYGVIYPLARRTPLQILVTQLRNTLQFPKQQSSSDEVQERTSTSRSGRAQPATDSDCQAATGFCIAPQNTPECTLWILVLGALAAKNTEHATFFFELVRTQAAALDVIKFSQLKDIMRKFLWLETACDRGACELWRSVNGDRMDNAGAVSTDTTFRKAVKCPEQAKMIDLICIDRP